MRELAKSLAGAGASVIMAPAYLSFIIRKQLLGADRAVAGSTEAAAWLPGLLGQYLRRALLSRILAGCSPTAVVGFGTIFSKAGAKLGENVYVGPGCFLGLVNIERDVLIGAGVHITSGRQTHGTADVLTPIRDQEGVATVVRIGRGAWIGSGAIVMADVGANAVVGAGSVVTSALPDLVVAAGVPARVIRPRTP